VRLTGILHVSLLTDFSQFFGPGSVPVIVAGSVLGVFELGERFASQRFKDDVSKWLLTFDVQKAKALPDGTQELFQGIFGERHFSWKCFIRSTIFSISAMIFLSLLVLLINPQLILLNFGPSWLLHYDLYLWALSLWLPWSITVDYISLFKTRVILHVITRLRRTLSLLTPLILVIDFLLYRLLFSITFAIILLVSVSISISVASGLPFNEVFSMYLSHFAHRSQLSYFPSITEGATALPFILFWSGLVPSIWMWLYVLALFVTRGLLRSEKLVSWLRYFLDVEKAPFRSIGAVAATVAFIASVAIILVSAEVSRISAAS
jgi:hypothetical protein